MRVSRRNTRKIVNKTWQIRSISNRGKIFEISSCSSSFINSYLSTLSGFNDIIFVYLGFVIVLLKYIYTYRLVCAKSHPHYTNCLIPFFVLIPFSSPSLPLHHPSTDPPRRPPRLETQDSISIYVLKFLLPSCRLDMPFVPLLTSICCCSPNCPIKSLICY